MDASSILQKLIRADSDNTQSKRRDEEKYIVQVKKAAAGWIRELVQQKNGLDLDHHAPNSIQTG